MNKVKSQFFSQLNKNNSNRFSIFIFLHVKSIYERSRKGNLMLLFIKNLSSIINWIWNVIYFMKNENKFCLDFIQYIDINILALFYVVKCIFLGDFYFLLVLKRWSVFYASWFAYIFKQDWHNHKCLHIGLLYISTLLP